MYKVTDGTMTPNSTLGEPWKIRVDLEVDWTKFELQFPGSGTFRDGSGCVCVPGRNHNKFEES